MRTKRKRAHAKQYFLKNIFRKLDLLISTTADGG